MYVRVLNWTAKDYKDDGERSGDTGNKSLARLAVHNRLTPFVAPQKIVPGFPGNGEIVPPGVIWRS
jgi:hypothetical protein